jgi:hypothetical protein
MVFLLFQSYLSNLNLQTIKLPRFLRTRQSDEPWAKICAEIVFQRLRQQESQTEPKVWCPHQSPEKVLNKDHHVDRRRSFGRRAKKLKKKFFFYIFRFGWLFIVSVKFGQKYISKKLEKLTLKESCGMSLGIQIIIACTILCTSHSFVGSTKKNQLKI